MRTIFIGVLLVLSTFAQAQVGNNLGLLDPNLAERAELLSLPNVNDKIADSIIAARPIATTGELDSVLSASLNDEEKTAVFTKLFRQIDLNHADDDTIMLIPGMTKRMAHEFEEYRPYTSLEQFRREMSKYVDDEEVARLEQYVFIPMELNSASDDALMTIPGMTKRMAHEFEEYRPYTSLDQFRREIGKYVDDNEVSRLESYIYLQN